MSSAIDVFLQRNYAKLRTAFHAHSRSAVPHSVRSHVDDAFHDWCIKLLTYWRAKGPPDNADAIIDENQFNYFFRPNTGWWPRQFIFWRSTWASYWKRWHLQHLRQNVPLDLESHDQPVRCDVPDSPLSEIELPVDPIAVLSPLLKPNDYATLLEVRRSLPGEYGSTSSRSLAAKLKRKLALLDRPFHNFTTRVRAAIISILYGRVVFLSSTYSDLKLHRRAVIDKIHKLAANGVPVSVFAMEHFMTGAGHPGHICLSLVRKSDIYIGLFARRYGSIWDVANMSFTEAELRAAEQERIKPCIYFPADDHLAIFPVNSVPDDLHRVSELKQQLAAAYVVERFGSPDELASLVADRLAASFW